MNITRRTLLSIAGLAAVPWALVGALRDNPSSPAFAEGYKAASRGTGSIYNPYFPSLFNNDEIEWRRGWIQYHVDNGFILPSK